MVGAERQEGHVDALQVTDGLHAEHIRVPLLRCVAEKIAVAPYLVGFVYRRSHIYFEAKLVGARLKGTGMRWATLR